MMHGRENIKSKHQNDILCSICDTWGATHKVIHTDMSSHIYVRCSYKADLISEVLIHALNMNPFREAMSLLIYKPIPL